MKPLKIYVGYDSREIDAYRVAVDSLLRHAKAPVSVTRLDIRSLQQHRLMRRPVKEVNGRMWDVISCSPQSTEFATSRFLTPILAQDGFALFTDCDVVFLRDIYDMVRQVESEAKALYVVKHRYQSTKTEKMDGQVQTAYPRKNWSSVMLFDCDHPSNQRINLDMINTLPGRDLHRFCWLSDSEIGELDPGWNWLVGEQVKPDYVGVAHFTLGGPWLPNWTEQEHDDIWRQAFKAAVLRSVRQSAFVPSPQSYS